MTLKKDSKNGSRMLECLLRKEQMQKLLGCKNSCVLVMRFRHKGEQWGFFVRARRLKKNE